MACIHIQTLHPRRESGLGMAQARLSLNVQVSRCSDDACMHRLRWSRLAVSASAGLNKAFGRLQAYCCQRVWLVRPWSTGFPQHRNPKRLICRVQPIFQASDFTPQHLMRLA